MDDQKRSLLAIALIIGFIYVWFEYFVPKPAPRPQEGAATSAPEATPTEVATAEPAPTPGAGAPAQPTLAASETRSVDTSLVHMVWSNLGGTLTRLDLKNYRASQAKDAEPVTVVPFKGGGEAPLQWTVQTDQGKEDDAHAVYNFASEQAHELVLSRTTGQQLEIRKAFAWKEDNYGIEHTLEITNHGTQTQRLTLSAHLGSSGTGGQAPSIFNPGDPLQVAAYINEKSVRLDPKDVLKREEIPRGDIAWAGFDSRYFLLTAIPVEGRWNEISAEATAPQGGSENPEAMRLDLRYLPRELRAGESLRLKIRLYAGPKDIGLLRATAENLDRAIDLGNWLGPIARPILLFLRWLYGHIPNYGIAIILLTVLVRLLMFPLTQMQAKSMRKMQEHKPQLDALREKYADDKERYQREMMNYLRTHRVNPMGGCLLILPQMPIFFALYRVLYNSIELRHAPFGLWVHDLSSHDPYFILPVLLAIVMFLQQQLTPTPGADPAQQKMMKVMPVMFGGLMVMLPAGLNLYIFVSTLWGIVQQWLIQRGATPATGTKNKLSATA